MQVVICLNGQWSDAWMNGAVDSKYTSGEVGPLADANCAGVQARYAGGVRDMLEAWVEHKPFEEDFYIVREGKLASQYQ